jgi:uncharacterized protein (DUF983 family)
MNKFLVAQCPRCGEIQAFYSTYKMKLCNRCGTKFSIDKCKKFGIYENHKLASEIVKKLKYTYKDGQYSYS